MSTNKKPNKNYNQNIQKKNKNKKQTIKTKINKTEFNTVIENVCVILFRDSLQGILLYVMRERNKKTWRRTDSKQRSHVICVQSENTQIVYRSTLEIRNGPKIIIESTFAFIFCR